MSNTPFVQVRDLRIRFGQQDVVHGIDFDVAEGETLALVGESGSGKTLSALSILQLLPTQAQHPSGSICVGGEEVIGAKPALLRSLRGGAVSMIFQEPMTSLNPLHTVGKQIGEMLFIHRGMSRREARGEALTLLERVRLPDAVNKLSAYPHELSGGQRQRVMIAMALANAPRLLIADEPTTALDVTIQANILELLRSLQAETGMGLLLITHDLGVVQEMADRVCVMHEGRIVEAGAATQIFGAPQQAYTRMLIESEPKGAPVPAAADAEVVFSVRDLAVRYRTSKGWFGARTYFEAVQPLSLDVRAGETLGVVGESGSGKTSLGLAMLRLIESSGGLWLGGETLQDEALQLKQAQIKPYRKDMQMVFQDPFGSLSPRMSVQQIVEEGLLVHEPQMDSQARAARVAEVLTEVELPVDAGSRFPHEFSGGQRQRISIARVLALRPKFIVMDEPTSALDVSVQAKIVELLRRLQATHGLAYLFISHDLKVVRALAHHLLVMQEGAVVEHGPAQQIFAAPAHTYTQQLLRAAFPSD